VSSRAHVIRYLENRLSACRALPALHTHQIAAYERLLELARGAADAGAYHRELEARDLTLAAVRAEWLDRYRNAACVYAALGDEAQRGAAAARFHAGGQRDFLAAIMAVEQQSAASIAAARASQEALAPLLISLLDWRIAAEDELREQRLREVRGLWRQLRAGDPGCTWERICSHLPYRARIPFDDAGLALLGEWLARAHDGVVEDPPGAAGGPVAAEPALRAAPAPAEPTEPGAPAERAEPAVEPAASPGPAHAYRVVYEAQDFTGREHTRRAYERILALEAEVVREGPDAAGDAFLCRVAENGLLDELARAPHLDWAEELRAHCAGRSQPAMMYHAGALAAAVAASPTAIAVEHERLRLDACFDVESAWDQILVHYAMCAITTALAGAPAEAVRESISVTAALFGASWDALLTTPRLWAFFCCELVPALSSPRPVIGAYRGEAGAGVLRAAGLAPRPAGDAPEQVRAHVAALVGSAAGATAAPAASGPGRALRLWGQPATLDAIADRLAAPPRPAIALDAAGATEMSALSAPQPP
jgi:hypothetical protein